MQTCSNSARTSLNNDNDDIYASDRTASPFETTPDDSDTLIENLLSELIFVNTNPQTVEKSLGIKSTTKKKESIIDIDDEDEGAEQPHIEKNKKKKSPSIPDNSDSEDNMRSQKKRKVKSTKKKCDSNTDSDDEARSVGKAGKSKKKKVIASSV